MKRLYATRKTNTFPDLNRPGEARCLIMASPASGDLLAAHLTGSELPFYAPWFLLERYQDSEYKKL
jgi:hypothetical protein